VNVLPEQISVLDEKLGRTRVLKRVNLGDQYDEGELDALISREVDGIASTLVEAGLLDPDCKLRMLAQTRQVANIDGLLAVVSGEELVRLVIVESKLFRNREQYRTVLAQILDYANHLQFDVTADEVIGKAEDHVRSWLQERQDDLATLIARGDFLLLICGDRIQPRLLDLAKPMLDRREHMLSRMELGLLSFALYEDEATRVLVPNLVGAVTCGERDLCIEVTVKTEAGLAVPATVDVVIREEVDARATPTRTPTRQWTDEAFFEQAKTTANAEEYEDPTSGLRALVAFVVETPGLSFRWERGKYGRFSVVADGTDTPIKLASIYSNGVVWVERADIATWLDPARATERTRMLGEELGISVKAEGKSVGLYDADDSYFDVNDERERQTLQRWFIETRDEIAATAHATG